MNRTENIALLIAYALVACVIVLGAYGIVSAGGSFAALAAATAAGAVLACVFMVVFNRMFKHEQEKHSSVRVVAVPALPLAFLAVAALVSACVAAYVVATGLLPATDTRLAVPIDAPVQLLVAILAYYAVTGLFEEAFFRGVLMRVFVLAAIARGFARPALVGVVLSAVIFAAVHAVGFVPANAFEVVQLVFKLVSAFEFGVILAVLYRETDSFALIVGVHAVFDIVSFGITDCMTSSVAATYATGVPSDLLVAVSTVVLLAYPCFRALKKL